MEEDVISNELEGNLTACGLDSLFASVDCVAFDCTPARVEGIRSTSGIVIRPVGDPAPLIEDDDAGKGKGKQPAQQACNKLKRSLRRIFSVDVFRSDSASYVVHYVQHFNGVGLDRKMSESELIQLTNKLLFGVVGMQGKKKAPTFSGVTSATCLLKINTISVGTGTVEQPKCQLIFFA